MSKAESSGAKTPKTRRQSFSRIVDIVGRGKEFLKSEVPTIRAVIQRGILLREKLLIEDEKARTELSFNQLSKELVPLVLAQWERSNAKFSPPVVIQSKSLANKIERLWNRVENVAWGRSNKSENEKLMEVLDRLLDVTVCSCVIRLCDDPDSECPNAKTCSLGAHIKCSCPLKISFQF